MTESTDPDLWFPTEPAPVVPVPASEVSRLRGKRVVTGHAKHGWRYDLRADDPVDNNGAQLVPVLLEADYYRAEIDQVEVFAPLIPMDRVWIEEVADATPSTPTAAPTPTDLLSRLVTLDAPPSRPPVPARDVLGLAGRRVVVVSPATARRDLRATTEPYQNPDGTICVRICDEPDWYRWAFTGQPAPGTEVPVYLIWAE